MLCGDFNTPRRESPDGSVISFARDSRGRLRPERGEPWDAAELGIVPGLRELGFADAFRAVHGYAERSPSWVWRHGGGWRLDHVFAVRPVDRGTPSTTTPGATMASATTRRSRPTSTQAGARVRRSRASSRVIVRLPQRTASA